MSLSKKSKNNNDAPVQKGPNNPDLDQLKVDEQDMSLGCRKLKRKETVGRVESLGKHETLIGSDVDVILRGERKRGNYDLGEEEDNERDQGPSKSLCCSTRQFEEDLTLDPHGAVDEEGLGEVEEETSKKAEHEIHQVVPVTFLPKIFSGEVELVTLNTGSEEEDNSQSGDANGASLAGENCADDIQEPEDAADSAEQDNMFVTGQTGTASSSVAVVLLNRFPSIDGEEDEDSEQVEVDDADRAGGGGHPVVEEEAGELGERWSTAEASSEPDQVWYRWVLLIYFSFRNMFSAVRNYHTILCSERTSDTLVAWAPPPRQLDCKRPEENED